MMKIDKDKKELRQYHCGYCGNKFEQWVGKCEQYNDAGQGSAVSSQVKCRKCGNFMKTWDD